MNALDMLRDDHRHIKQLLKNLIELASHDPVARTGLVDRLSFDLDVHARLEEEVFYPALTQATAGEHEVVMQEAVEEHRLIEKALADLGQDTRHADTFVGRAKVLKELIEHHVAEEDRDMFPLARSVMDEAQLNALGHQLLVRRAELFAGMPETEDATLEATAGRLGEEAMAVMGKLETRAVETAEALMKEPARVIGRGIEEVVRGGTHLAGEIITGVRKGLAEGRRETQDNQTPH